MSKSSSINTSEPTAAAAIPARVAENAARFAVDSWADGFFSINSNGTVAVRPDRRSGREVDLLEIVDGVRERGFSTPVLLHFGDVLETVLGDLRHAFDGAI